MTALPPAIALALLGAVLGAVFGSFIATLAIRWPAGRSVARGRSACDGCAAPIAAIDLVPLLSFLARRGRARCCGAPIDPLHPLAEAAGAAIGALAFLVAPPADAMAGAIFGWFLLALALLDARHFWLPDRLTLPLALLGLAGGALGLAPALPDRLLGGLLGFAAFAAIRHGYRLLRGREGMGGGDAKLFGAIGLWLGWRALPLVLLLACALALLTLLLGHLRGRRHSMTSRLPLGIFLALAGFLCWLGTWGMR